MRIGIDATSWDNRRGFGRFGRNVVRAMVERGPSDEEYVLLLDAGQDLPADLPERARVRPVRLAARAEEAAAADANRPPADLVRLGVAARRARLDVLLFPSVYTFFPTPGVRTVVGIHDAIARDLPNLTLPTRRARMLWRAKEEVAIRGASRVFTVSEASRAVLERRYGLPSSRVAVTGEAPDAVFSPRSESATAAAQAALGLPHGRPYLLYAGGISPHKDIVSLVDAYAKVRDSLEDPPALVIAGDLDRDPYLSSAAAVKQRIAAHDLGADVLLPGFISDEQLACMYSGALAVANPSLAEGFGLPAVEAAACGAATVLSDLPAHRETMGDCALYFAPRDVEALAGRILELVAHPECARRLGERGRSRVAALSWATAAGRLRDVVVDAARS